MSGPTTALSPPRAEPDATMVLAPQPAPRSRWNPRWTRPAAVILLACVLVAAAYLLGRAFAGGGRDAGAAAYRGATTEVQGLGATARCTAPASRDAAGNTVGYAAGNAVDGHDDTAWRCPGHAIGQQLVVTLPHATTVGELGIVPGYAKTDPASGTDRYAENNRITRVAWTLGGHRYVQTMTGDPGNRSRRTLRIPPTRTDEVRLEVLAVDPGPRDTTMISELRVGAVR